MSVEIAGFDLIEIVKWVMRGVELLLIPLLPFPLNAVAEGIVNILAALIETM